MKAAMVGAVVPIAWILISNVLRWYPQAMPYVVSATVIMVLALTLDTYRGAK